MDRDEVWTIVVNLMEILLEWIPKSTQDVSIRWRNDLSNNLVLVWSYMVFGRLRVASFEARTQQEGVENRWSKKMKNRIRIIENDAKLQSLTAHAAHPGCVGRLRLAVGWKVDASLQCGLGLSEWTGA